jgi:hypothetical protein
MGWMPGGGLLSFCRARVSGLMSPTERSFAPGRAWAGLCIISDVHVCWPSDLGSIGLTMHSAPECPRATRGGTVWLRLRPCTLVYAVASEQQSGSTGPALHRESGTENSARYMTCVICMSRLAWH